MLKDTRTKKTNRQRSSLRVVACCDPAIGDVEGERLRRLADRYSHDEPAFVSSLEFSPLVRQGAESMPALIIGDQREIGLYSQVLSSQLEYRMALLAEPGDLVVVNKRDRGFERYLRDYLQLEGVRYIEPVFEPGATMAPLTIRCRTDKRLLSEIKDVARNAGGLIVLPYLTTGNAWRLARNVAEDLQVAVSVCGPASRISSRANDKIWFAHCVRQLIGPQAAPPTFAAYGPAAAAAHVARLAGQFERVVVKIPNSAGSAGNIAFDSKRISDLSVGALRRIILSLLHARGWQDRYPILVGVWESDIISTPSVQMWIPLAPSGPPIIEGIFEQIVQGAEGKFVGAVPAALSADIKAQLVAEAGRIAAFFQNLGYFGRCSVDAIISNGPEGQWQVHWVECNGRWGGVSIPMTLANRLCDDQSQKGLVIAQQSEEVLPAHTVAQVTQLLGDLLFRRGTSKSGIVLLSSPEAQAGARMNFLAIGDDQDMAEKMAAEALARLD